MYSVCLCVCLCECVTFSSHFFHAIYCRKEINANCSPALRKTGVCVRWRRVTEDITWITLSRGKATDRQRLVSRRKVKLKVQKGQRRGQGQRMSSILIRASFFFRPFCFGISTNGGEWSPYFKGTICRIFH